MTDVHPHVSSTFLRVAGKITQRAEEREASRKELEQNLKRIRKLKFSKLSKEEIAEELGEMEAKIQGALDKEGRISKPEAPYEPNKALMDKIELLEKRLAHFILVSQDRQSKIDQLESKINQKMDLTASQQELARKEVDRLKQRYEYLSGKKGTSKSALERLSKKISALQGD